VANWQDFAVPKGFDLAPPEEHPLYVRLPSRRQWDPLRVQDKLAMEPFEAFNPTKDPIFFFLHRSGANEEAARVSSANAAKNMLEWSQIAVFDSGLVVLPKDSDLPKERLLQDISFVIDRRHAWPLHWCLDTPLLEIAIGWEQGLESPKLPKDFPPLVKKESRSAGEIAWYKPHSADGSLLQQPAFPRCQYYPIEDQKILSADIAANPIGILQEWVTKSVFIKPKIAQYRSVIIQASIAKLLTRAFLRQEREANPFFNTQTLAPSDQAEDDDDDEVVGIRALEFFPSGRGYSIHTFRWAGVQPYDEFEWIAPVGTITPKEKELWIRKEPLTFEEEARVSASGSFSLQSMDVDDDL